jgi:tRNA A58 N-methylase Trm61
LPPVLCRGEACDVITFDWDADHYRVAVRNISNRPVRVTVHGWLLSFEINLRPKEVRLIEATEIEQPVYAAYLP